MIELDDVVRRFGALTAVDGVSLTVSEGEVVGLLGHNGAGKTTIIRLVNGLLPPDGGSIRTHGLDPTRDGREVRSRTGVLTEYPALDDFLTPRENLEVYAAIHGVPAGVAHERAIALLERLEVGEAHDGPARNLSAGLKQRVAIARALIHEPALLLLDEPTNNLDPIAAREVRVIVRELARDHGRTVLMSTHNLAEAAAMCDRVAIVRNGRLLAIGTPGELGERVGVGTVEIEVAAGSADAAARLVGDRAVAESGRVLSVAAPPSEVPAVVRKLVEGGIDVHRVQPREASLEDVYVQLHDPAAVAATDAGVHAGSEAAARSRG